MHLAVFDVEDTCRHRQDRKKNLVRIAAVGDLHYGRAAAPGTLQPLFAQISEAADILVLPATSPTTVCRTRRARWRASFRR